ncbi:MAG: zf-HC2 domain-containing protein [Verrucomicrobia subdivision 3 bacterium]|nr:zf-HC2 domain-containing protein [Limisphaerales bacterium]
MKCNEVRNLVLVYLDSELDAKTSQEVERHLRGCAECAELFAHEQKFDERVSSVLRRGQATLELWERVESRLRPRPRLSWLFRRWRPVTIGGIAVLASSAVLALLINLRSNSTSLDIASNVDPDHTKYVAGQLTPQFENQPPTEALSKEQGRLDAAAFSKLPATSGFRSEGKRVCHLSGVPVAWIMGRDGGLPVSVVVLRRDELVNFPQLRERLEAGHPVVCVRTGRYQFAARVVGEHVVCAMAATSQERLEALVKSVPDAG